MGGAGVQGLGEVQSLKTCRFSGCLGTLKLNKSIGQTQRFINKTPELPGLNK